MAYIRGGTSRAQRSMAERDRESDRTRNDRACCRFRFAPKPSIQNNFLFQPFSIKKNRRCCREAALACLGPGLHPRRHQRPQGLSQHDLLPGRRGELQEKGKRSERRRKRRRPRPRRRRRRRWKRRRRPRLPPARRRDVLSAEREPSRRRRLLRRGLRVKKKTFV